MRTIGLTGGFGAGKTTALSMFKRSGACVLSADVLAHGELKDNSALKEKIKKAFGPEVFKNGKVDRRLLADRVFSSRKDRKRLNALIHPLVKKRILDVKRRLSKSKKGAVLVVEVPLLFETGFDKFFDTTIGVAADLRTLKKRLVREARFGTRDLKARTAAQLPVKEKIGRCDFVIDNNKNKEKTFNQVKKLMDLFKKEKQWKNWK